MSHSLSLLDRVIVPQRLALMSRGGKTLGYNPELNIWHRLDDDTSLVLRWLRAKRERAALQGYLERHAGLDERAQRRLQEIIVWCVFRKLLYLEGAAAPVAGEARTGRSLLDTVYWICTQACNLRCTYCYQDADEKRANELSTEEGKALIDQAVEAGASVFIFTGGEPFTRKDLLELAGYARSRGLIANVITNGHYIRSSNIHQVAAIFNRVTISLDHGNPKHHDKFRGAGSWRRAVDAIDLLLEHRVDVDVNSVVAREGLEELDELIDFGRGRALGEHRIIPQFPMGRGGQARGDELTPTDLLTVNDRIFASRKRLDSVVTTEGRYSTRATRRDHCGAGLSEVSVDPEGWVYPCRLLQFGSMKGDNVRERTLADIYAKNATLRRVQQTTADELEPCKTCVIKNHCGGGCRGIHFSFTGSHAGTSPMFCAYLRSAFEVQAWSSTGDVPRARRGQYHPRADSTQWGQLVPLTRLSKRSTMESDVEQ